jgi:antirestriction protein
LKQFKIKSKTIQNLNTKTMSTKIEIIAALNFKGQDYEVELTPESDQDIVNLIVEEIRCNIDIEDDIEDISIEDIKITHWGDLENEDEKHRDLETVYKINESNQDSDLEIILAYAEAVGIDYISDVDEAYQGQYGSDEEFAEDVAEQLDLIDKNASWPQNCIDWEQAARELMWDYTESHGYYFRNL